MTVITYFVCKQTDLVLQLDASCFAHLHSIIIAQSVLLLAVISKPHLVDLRKDRFRIGLSAAFTGALSDQSD